MHGFERDFKPTPNWGLSELCQSYQPCNLRCIINFIAMNHEPCCRTVCITDHIVHALIRSKSNDIRWSKLYLMYWSTFFLNFFCWVSVCLRVCVKERSYDLKVTSLKEEDFFNAIGPDWRTFLGEGGRRQRWKNVRCIPCLIGRWESNMKSAKCPLGTSIILYQAGVGNAMIFSCAAIWV